MNWLAKFPFLNIKNLGYLTICVLFTFYAFSFIEKTSFTVRGTKYYVLFDDAMISMKYAWNFAQGNGLVWNVGERVEGYTNFLWVVIMSVPMHFLNKIDSVHFVQVFGVVLYIVIGLLSLKLSNLFFSSTAVKTLLLISVLSYYPLIYWVLFGMETGLVAVLFLLVLITLVEYLKSRNQMTLYLLGLALALLYLTRPDSIIYALVTFGVIFAYDFYGKKFSLHNINWKFLVPLAVLGLVVTIQTAFRYFYYGELIPNTVLLKVVNFPLLIRLETGAMFVWKYILEIWPILLLASLSVVSSSMRKEKIILLLFIWITIFYQIYVGGDAWDYWRFFVPIFPLLMILFFSTLLSFMEWMKFKNKVVIFCLILSVFLLGFGIYTWRFFDEITLKESPYQVVYNERNVRYLLKLQTFLKPGGKVSVFWAGTIPYYTDYYFIDILGKMDQHIASKDIYINKKADFGKRTVPGHNKFDLKYSIIDLNPDVVQNVAWMGQNIGGHDKFNFKSYKINGIEFWVNEGSERVEFSKLKH